MTESVQRHFNKLLKEHYAKKPVGYSRNTGKRSRNVFNVGSVSQVSGLFDSFECDSDEKVDSPAGPLSSTLAHQRSEYRDSPSTSRRVRSSANDEEYSSPRKKSRLCGDTEVHNRTVTIGTQTAQEEDLNEEDPSNESFSSEQFDETGPNITYKNVGTQMDPDSPRRNSTFLQRSSRSFRSAKSPGVRFSPAVKVIRKDADTSVVSNRSYRKSSQFRPAAISEDSDEPVSLPAYNQPLLNGSGTESDAVDTQQDRLAEVSQHSRASSSKQVINSSLIEDISAASGDSQRKTPVKKIYTQSVSKKLPNSHTRGDTLTKGSPKKHRFAHSMRGRYSLGADLKSRKSLAVPVYKDSTVQTEPMPESYAHVDDVDQWEDVVREHHVSPQKLTQPLTRRSEKHEAGRSTHLRSVRTEPKPSHNQITHSSRNVANASSRSKQNLAKRELTFSGRRSASTKLKDADSKITLSSKAKKTLRYPNATEKSPLRPPAFQTSKSTLRASPTMSLVNYSLSDPEVSASGATPRASQSFRSQNSSSRSKKKRRRSSRMHRSHFKSMREEAMAAELEKTLKKRDKYTVSSDDTDVNIQLSATSKKRSINRNVPISWSSATDHSSKYRPSASPNNQHGLSARRTSNMHKIVKRIESDSYSSDYGQTTVIENSRVAMRAEVDRELPPEQLSDQVGSEDFYGLVPGKQYSNVTKWLQTGNQNGSGSPRERMNAHVGTGSESAKSQSKRLSQNKSDMGRSSQSFSNTSVIQNRRHPHNRLPNGFGPPSSTPRVSKASRIRNGISDEGEGDDLRGFASEDQDTGWSMDSYTVDSRHNVRNRASSKKHSLATSIRNASMPEETPKSSRKPTPKNKHNLSRRIPSPAHSDVNDIYQSHNSPIITPELPPQCGFDEVTDPIVNEDRNISKDVSSPKKKPDTPDAAEEVSTIAKARDKKSTSKGGRAAKKTTKKSKKPVSQSKQLKHRDIVCELIDEDAKPICDEGNYVVMPLRETTNDNEDGLRRSKRVRANIFRIGEKFEYSKTFDENGFRQIIGIRKKKTDVLPSKPAKGQQKTNSKTKNKTAAKKKTKASKKTTNDGAGTSNTQTSNPQSADDVPTITTIDEEADRTGTYDETEQPETSDVNFSDRTMSIAERTVNLLNSTTNSYSTVDFLSVISNDSGALGNKPDTHQVYSGVHITRGINLSDCGMSSAVQGSITIKPRSRKKERVAGSGTMCFFVHQGILELTLSGETANLPQSSYFQVPYKNRYALFNPHNTNDTVLFYSLTVEKSVLDAISERT